jgi:PTS system nitrogen regulatory IIA component
MESMLSSLITEGHALARIKARSKKHALEMLAEMLAEAMPPDQESEDQPSRTNLVMEALVRREKLGSTGLGEGIALPHASIPQLEHMAGALITLQQPVDYETPDGEPVDVIMGLIAPSPAQDSHRTILAMASQILTGHAKFCGLRSAQDSEELHDALKRLDEAMEAQSLAAAQEHAE